MRSLSVVTALGAALTPAPRSRRAAAAAARSLRRAAVDLDLDALAAGAELSPFAAKIEDEVIKRYGDEATRRVRQSWRLMDREYVHFDQMVPGDEYMKQEARSYLPGLSPVPFWDLSETQWAKNLEASWDVVRDEFRAVALADADRTAREGTNVWIAAADGDSAQKYGQDWRTLVLMDRTTWEPTNCGLFPKTAALLADAGVPCVEAFFAAMKPRSKINPHTDSCNFILTSHLGLEIPAGCSITVGDQTREWTPGGVMLFDTSIYHDAVNDSDETRYILMLRVWHPELSDVEVQALQFLFDVLDVPDLISDDPWALMNAERELASLRTRPEERASLAPPPAAGAPPPRPKTGKKKKKRSKAKGGGFGVPA